MNHKKELLRGLWLRSIGIGRREAAMVEERSSLPYWGLGFKV